MTEECMKRQQQLVIEAVEKAEEARWRMGARVRLDERMSTKLCIDLLAHGIMVIGEGENTYGMCIIPESKVKDYLNKAKAQI